MSTEPLKRGRAPKKPEDKSVRINITVSPELNERLLKYAAEEERALSWCFQKALDAWLKGKGY